MPEIFLLCVKLLFIIFSYQLAIRLLINKRKVAQPETLKVLMPSKVEIAQQLDILPDSSKEFRIDAVEDVKDEEIALVAKHLLTLPNVSSPKRISENTDDTITLDFNNEGDLIYLIGTSKNDITASEYLSAYRNIQTSVASVLDWQEEKNIQEVLAQLIENKAIQSARSVSCGGLFVALAKSAIPNSLGFSIRTNSAFRKDAFLFGEAQNRVLVSITLDQYTIFDATIAATDVKASFLGKVKKGNFLIDAETIMATSEAKYLIEKTWLTDETK